MGLKQTLGPIVIKMARLLSYHIKTAPPPPQKKDYL